MNTPQITYTIQSYLYCIHTQKFSLCTHTTYTLHTAYPIHITYTSLMLILYIMHRLPPTLDQ